MSQSTIELLEMLTYRRPNRSKSEKRYIREFIAPYCEPDQFGNYWVKIGDNPRVMFSSHTDTVHRQGGMQKIEIDSHTQTVYVSDPNSNCLGADDGTGNWIMLEMIRADIPGLYVFHRGEESGGQGSNWIARHNVGFLAGIDHAIAFDRMGFDDVIDSQSSGKCCSPEFSEALAASLTGLMGTEWQPHYGIFTDTANYNHLIPECTNLSVGYDAQHTKNESQSIEFAAMLRDACLELDWQSLPVARDVNDFDDGSYYYGYGRGGSNVYDYYGRDNRGQSHNPGLARHAAMVKFIESNSDAVADYLIDMNMTPTKIRNYDWLTDGDYRDDYDDSPYHSDNYYRDDRALELGSEWVWDSSVNCYVNTRTGEMISS